MGDSFKINIMGQNYFIKGSHGQEYVNRLESIINEKIEEVKAAGAPVDTANLMVLIAINLVDDYLQKEDDLALLQEKIENNSERLINLIDSRS